MEHAPNYFAAIVQASRASNIDNEMPITFNLIDFSPEKKTLTDRTNVVLTI
ncbi:hypothetical protein DAI22_06g199803 [Oryza sativa Japonica Group]|jgi:hypothetical protein|nr:hypothetical protein DAI22_06g199803 [Oryza sativa Japonica Group]